MGHARSNVSSHGLSKSLRYLLVTLASSSPWNRPSLVSPKFSLANTITCPRSHSTWLETFQRSLPRQSDWPLRPVTKFTAALFAVHLLLKKIISSRVPITTTCQHRSTTTLFNCPQKECFARRSKTVSKLEYCYKLILQKPPLFCLLFVDVG